MTPSRATTLIWGFIGVLLIAVSCSRSESDSPQIAVGIRYDAPIIPISVSITTAGVSVSIEGRLQTPFGTFAAISQVQYPVDRKILILRVAENVTTYLLDDRRFTVALPNDLNGRSSVTYDGKGNITVDIPDPITQGVPPQDTAQATSSASSETESAEQDSQADNANEASQEAAQEPADAAKDEWHVVTITNATDYVLVYAISDGDSAFETQQIQPGQGWIHRFKSPNIRVRFSSAVGQRCECIEYSLTGTTVHGVTDDAPSHQYTFRVDNNRLDLYSESEN